MDNGDVNWLLAPESERNGSYLTEQNAQATNANRNASKSRGKSMLATISTKALMTVKGQRAVALDILYWVNYYKLKWQ